MRWPCQHCLINIHVHIKSITIFLFHEPLPLWATKTADSTCCFPLYLNSFVDNLFFYDLMKVSLKLPHDIWYIISIHAFSQLVYIHTHTHTHIFKCRPVRLMRSRLMWSCRSYQICTEHSFAALRKQYRSNLFFMVPFSLLPCVSVCVCEFCARRCEQRSGSFVWRHIELHVPIV